MSLENYVNCRISVDFASIKYNFRRQFKNISLFDEKL